jgi:hypothetical protein
MEAHAATTRYAGKKRGWPLQVTAAWITKIPPSAITVIINVLAF